MNEGKKSNPLNPFGGKTVRLPSTPLPPQSLSLQPPNLPSNLSSVLSSLNPQSPSSSKTKDGLIRMLLQSQPIALSSLDLSSEEEPEPLLPRGGHVGADKLAALVLLDHNYAKPWNWRPENSLCQPTRTLYIPSVTTNPGFEASSAEENEFVDVVSEPSKPVPPYDPQQACKVMNECEKFIGFANLNIAEGRYEEEDLVGWEERICKEGWSTAQTKLYGKIMKVLSQDRLARLALDGVNNEPIHRRILVDRSARRVRQVLASPPTVWDRVLVSWLHSTLTRHLPRPFLAAWLDILQTVRHRVPALVEGALSLSAPPAPPQQPSLSLRSLESECQGVARAGLGLLLRRPWDPALSSLASRRLARLPGSPVLVVAPPGPADPRVMARRMRLWNNQLGCLGKVIVINMPAPRGVSAGRTPVSHYLYQMVSATLSKVRELKGGPGVTERPVILMGWGVGAAIAAHVAGVEKLAALVCLGFPMATLAGHRGQVGDPFLETKTPTLFVVGEKATQSSCDDIEDLRERLSVETGLIIVGGADDGLRLSKKKKKVECVTQCMVDRNILDEIRDFLVIILSNRHTTEVPTFAMPSHESFVSVGALPRKNIKGRKRSSSTAEGPPLSPVKPNLLLKTGPSSPFSPSPQTGNPLKKARKARKSKSTDSPDYQSFSLLPAHNLPPSLLSISSPLPPSSLTYPPPSLLSECPPSPSSSKQAPTRVIQYVGQRERPALPITSSPAKSPVVTPTSPSPLQVMGEPSSVRSPAPASTSKQLSHPQEKLYLISLPNFKQEQS